MYNVQSLIVPCFQTRIPDFVLFDFQAPFTAVIRFGVDKSKVGDFYIISEYFKYCYFSLAPPAFMVCPLPLIVILSPLMSITRSQYSGGL